MSRYEPFSFDNDAPHRSLEPDTCPSPVCSKFLALPLLNNASTSLPTFGVPKLGTLNPQILGEMGDFCEFNAFLVGPKFETHQCVDSPLRRLVGLAL